MRMRQPDIDLRFDLALPSGRYVAKLTDDANVEITGRDLRARNIQRLASFYRLSMGRVIRTAQPATHGAERWFSVKVRTVVPARSIRAKDWRDPRCCCDDRDNILDSESHRGAQRRGGGFSN
jgi:hypothetical protein